MDDGPEPQQPAQQPGSFDPEDVAAHAEHDEDAQPARDTETGALAGAPITIGDVVERHSSRLRPVDPAHLGRPDA
jgi:hypothetical protein